MLEPWRFVENQNRDFVPPSELLKTANQYVPDHKPTGLTYAGKKGAAAVGYEYEKNGKENFIAIFLNPYTGDFLKKQKTIGEGGFDFFRFVISGHRYLWLPPKIGKPVVGISILIFVVLLITGLVLWWPKNFKKKKLKKAFRIKWTAKFKRLNYDLHKVLGFYSLIFALILALTGLVISFQWFKNSVHFLASGGKETHFQYPQSVVPPNMLEENSISSLDRAWYKVMKEEKNIPKGMYVSPDIKGEKAPIFMIAYHNSNSFYDRNTYYFDQYSLQRIHTSQDSYSKASFADKLSMLNYDIHIGTALGFFGKILAFLTSLIAASLPVTGFLYWWKKPKKKRKK